ncbi:MAG TPA: nuclear transport factor 2 family protein [Spirochaetia bacterium]|nr:nuclear transport factor 2 family protein [Spirochaetia bacterium]
MKEVEPAAIGVTRLFEEYSEAMISGDSEWWGGLWDEKAIRMPPNVPALFGVDAITECIERSFRKWRWEFAVNTEEIKSLGDLAIARGSYLATISSFDGGEREFLDGKFLTVFRRQPDGSWKILRECYNSNTSKAFP